MQVAFLLKTLIIKYHVGVLQLKAQFLKISINNFLGKSKRLRNIL